MRFVPGINRRIPSETESHVRSPPFSIGVCGESFIFSHISLLLLLPFVLFCCCWLFKHSVVLWFLSTILDITIPPLIIITHISYFHYFSLTFFSCRKRRLPLPLSFSHLLSWALDISTKRKEVLHPYQHPVFLVF